MDFGIKRAPISSLVGGDSVENARITNAIFAGEPGAHRDAVVLNAAAAIAAYLGNFELSLHERMKIGIERAIGAIDSGACATLVKQWVELSKKISA